ncbi:MAG TPA: tetratricopeptide repeat protein [Rhizomicrobium sp.]|nr:tetratricopeptide repeat protein [Rhizomicrobium sp.]
MAQTDQPPDERSKLLTAARARLASGDAKFSIAALCAETGVTRAEFRAHFTGKAALMAALVAPVAPQEGPDSKADVSQPGVTAPDAWLERRLRVFERALTVLEAKTDAAARAQSQAITRLEERLAVQPEAYPVTEETPQAPAPAGEAEAPPRPAADLLPAEPVIIATVSRAEMTEVLQAARGKAVAASEPEIDRNLRLRWLTIGALSLVALLFCVGLTLGDTAGATVQGQGATRRHVAADGLARTMALADFGDARAQAQLALAYLRGGDAASAARWSAAAAESGQPVAQYLLASLTPDKARAFALLRAAAAQGNLKAMHNLAITYAQGQGTARDEARAAEWFARAAERGYVDSAFDLAVLYERGLGVPQDLCQALKWYAIAALAGDASSKARAEFLRGQLSPLQARRAMDAAQVFAPLPASDFANRL